jgi:DNA invertase Pin-like site-specific DNA recombinase
VGQRSFARNRGGRGGQVGSVHSPAAGIAALGYVRVSTDEQSASGAGLVAQRAAIEAEAARRGWQLLDVVEDAGFSGRDLRRPGIRAVLDALRSGRAAALIVAKVDRLSRSMVDFTALMDRSAREGWALVALDLGVDTSTPSGEAMVNVMATFSQFERRLIGQRTKEALAVKRAQGVRLGRPPVLSDAVVQRMRQERAAGATLQAIADGLDRDGIPTAQGGRCWHAATVRDVIRASERRMSAGPPAKPQASGKRHGSRRLRVLGRGGRRVRINAPTRDPPI